MSGDRDRPHTGICFFCRRKEHKKNTKEARFIALTRIAPQYTMETAYQDENGYYFDPPVKDQEEEERYYYHQPLTHHYHHHNQDFAAAESHFYRIQQQDYSQENFVTRIFMLLNTRGALIALAISIGVILFTQHKGEKYIGVAAALIVRESH